MWCNVFLWFHLFLIFWKHYTFLYDQDVHIRVPVVAQWVQIPTSIHEDVGSIPGLARWVKGSNIALRWGVSHRLGSDLASLWLWCRPAATGLIPPLYWERPYASGVALKRIKDVPINTSIISKPNFSLWNCLWEAKSLKLILKGFIVLDLSEPISKSLSSLSHLTAHSYILWVTRGPGLKLDLEGWLIWRAPCFAHFVCNFNLECL